jgi:hypothetical protein
MDVLEVIVRPPMRLGSCGLVEGIAGTVSTMSLTIRLGGRAAVRVPARGTHAAGIAVVIHVTHAATWAAMKFLRAGVPACFGAPTHSVAQRLSAWDTPTTDRLAAIGGCGGGQCRDHLEDESSPLTPVIDACGFIAWAYPSWRAPRLAAEVTASHERNARCQRIRQDIARHDTARVGLTRLPGRALFNARSETEAL